MTRNIRIPYAGQLKKGRIPGVYPLEREFVVYLYRPQGGRGKQAGIYADRKFKTEEGARLYFDSQPEENKRPPTAVGNAPKSC